MWRPNASLQSLASRSKKPQSEFDYSSSDDSATLGPVSQCLRNKVKADAIEISGKLLIYLSFIANLI
jgi:hypothetical protein